MPSFRVMPARLAGAEVLVGKSGGFQVAVTTAGALILRLPMGAAGFRRRLREWGCEVVPGRPGPVRRTLAHGTVFQLDVWRACRRIPAGRTLTYGELARRIGCRSARAVGGALGANPLAGLIPCHRVVAADGPGGFAWGHARKRRWLRAEVDGLAR